MCAVRPMRGILNATPLRHNLSDRWNREEHCVSGLKSYTPGAGGSTAVFSAADLFVFYKKCLVQCASLSTGPPLLDLTDVFKKYLQEYATKILTASLPKYTQLSSTLVCDVCMYACSIRLSSGGGGVGARLTLAALRRDTSEVRLTGEELSMTCSILCTADYCQDTTLQVRHRNNLNMESGKWD